MQIENDVSRLIGFEIRDSANRDWRAKSFLKILFPTYLRLFHHQSTTNDDVQYRISWKIKIHINKVNIRFS